MNSHLVEIYCPACLHYIGKAPQSAVQATCEKCNNTFAINHNKLNMLTIKRSNEPIIEFETLEQAITCLKEWQTRLFLDDWIIKLSLVEELKENGIDLAGQAELQDENKAVHIRLVKRTEDNSTRIGKFCHEKTLIHELLHCKYMGIEEPIKQIEHVFWEVSQHALLEQMSKSLLMAKYNLDFKWFKNF